jgi:hypothetical protein
MKMNTELWKVLNEGILMLKNWAEVAKIVMLLVYLFIN